MFYPPSIGDRFAYPNADHPIGAVERVTRDAEGTIWLWCGGTPYPWHLCEPIGIWQALALAFVADLGDCTSYTQVTDLLAGLSDADRATIWAVCPPDLKEQIRLLKTEADPLQSLINKLATCRFHQDVDALLATLSADEKPLFNSLPWEVRGRLAMLPDRPKLRHQSIPTASTRQSPTRQSYEKKATAVT